MRSTAIFGPEFAFDRATRLRVRGGQSVIDLASGAQVHVLQNVSTIQCGAACVLAAAVRVADGPGRL